MFNEREYLAGISHVQGMDHKVAETMHKFNIGDRLEVDEDITVEVPGGGSAYLASGEPLEVMGFNEAQNEYVIKASNGRAYAILASWAESKLKRFGDEDHDKQNTKNNGLSRKPLGQKGEKAQRSTSDILSEVIASALLAGAAVKVKSIDPKFTEGNFRMPYFDRKLMVGKQGIVKFPVYNFDTGEVVYRVQFPEGSYDFLDSELTDTGNAPWS